MSAHDVNRLLARTINFAHSLDAVHGGDPAKMVKAEDLTTCAAAGFSAVRLPIQFVEHLTSDGRDIRADFLERVDQMIEEGLRAGMAIVLANHLDPELMAQPEDHSDRLRRIWSVLSRRYREASPKLIMEPLAEPVGALSAVWNEVFADVLSTIRGALPDRAVVVGPTHYNNMRQLPHLMLPEADRNLIVSIHHYYPVEFTMQGETWLDYGDPRSWLGNTFVDDADNRALFSGAMDVVARWAIEHDRPIFMGEFGTSPNADLSSRIAWTRLSKQLAQERGFSWGIWAFSQTFELFDHSTNEWNRPLLSALMT